MTLHVHYNSHIGPCNLKTWEIMNTNVKPVVIDTSVLEKNVPLHVLSSLSRKQKRDITKYIVMYLHGGVYTDPSVACSINVECLDKSFNVYLGTHIETGGTFNENESISSNVLKVCNVWFYSSVPGHPFWKDVYQECLSSVNEDFQDVITRVYNSNEYHDIFKMDYTFTQTSIKIKRNENNKNIII